MKLEGMIKKSFFFFKYQKMFYSVTSKIKNLYFYNQFYLKKIDSSIDDVKKLTKEYLEEKTQNKNKGEELEKDFHILNDSIKLLAKLEMLEKDVVTNQTKDEIKKKHNYSEEKKEIVIEEKILHKLKQNIEKIHHHNSNALKIKNQIIEELNELKMHLDNNFKKKDEEIKSYMKEHNISIKEIENYTDSKIENFNTTNLKINISSNAVILFKLLIGELLSMKNDETKKILHSLKHIPRDVWELLFKEYPNLEEYFD
jgi:chromosome segregation ATPase